MKTSVKLQKELTSITPIIISTTPKNTKLLKNVILGTDHHVKVTNTMIKVTYKKPFKDINSTLFKSSGLNLFSNSFDANMIKDTSNSESEESPSSSKDLYPPKKRKVEYINGEFSFKDSDKDDDNAIDILNQSKVVKKLKVSKEGKIQSIKFLKNVSGSSNFSDEDEDEDEDEGEGEGGDLKQNIDRIKEKTALKKKISLGTKVKKPKNKPGKIKPAVSKAPEPDPVEAEDASGRKPILLVDPDLPKGWSRYIRTKNKGCFDEKHIVYVVSPQGKKFRYKWKLRKYLDKTQSDLDIDRFFFGLYKRKSQGNAFEEKESPEKNIKVQSSNNVSSPGQGRQGYFKKKYGKVISRPELAVDAEGRELLLQDPDLPYGWKRIITTDTATGKLRVHIISPEGTIFRRKYRLLEFLAKHEYSYTPDQFYFGLYPKEENADDPKKSGDIDESNLSDDDSLSDEDLSKGENEDGLTEEGAQKFQDVLKPMYEDPNLPEGWRRTIKVRTCGETAGRMEVIIISPDGRKHRTRAHLEHYLSRKNLKLNSEDFDFTVFGKSKKRVSTTDTPPKEPQLKTKRKQFKASKVKPVQDLDLKKVKEAKITPIGQIINSVNGLMVSCGLSSARNERRLRLPRNVLEKNIKKHFESQPLSEFSDVSAHWVETLVKCRGEFRTLESDAACLIAEKTKLFLQKLSEEAFKLSQHQEEGLKYEDLAEIIVRSESLSPLQTLIPKKITYKEFVKLNRPKHFMSFT